MSYLKLLLAFICTSSLFFTSCEDTKKTSLPTTEDLHIQEKKIVKDTIDEETFPKLSSENAVDFLTAYGQENKETMVRIKTSHGSIDIELFEDTPLHRANFIYLVKRKTFDDSFFHRVVPNFIIQAGDSDTKTTPRKRAEIGKGYLLPSEVNKRKHVYGTVSGAKQYRENPDKQTFPFEFFIFLGPQSSTGHLNGNYTIFGKVTAGMKVVEKIANLPTEVEDDWPLTNVYITAEVLN